MGETMAIIDRNRHEDSQFGAFDGMYSAMPFIIVFWAIVIGIGLYCLG